MIDSESALYDTCKCNASVMFLLLDDYKNCVYIYLCVCVCVCHVFNH